MSGIPNWYAVKLVAQMLFRRGRYVNFSEYKKVRGYQLVRGEEGKVVKGGRQSQQVRRLYSFYCTVSVFLVSEPLGCDSVGV